MIDSFESCDTRGDYPVQPQPLKREPFEPIETGDFACLLTRIENEVRAASLGDSGDPDRRARFADALAKSYNRSPDADRARIEQAVMDLVDGFAEESARRSVAEWRSLFACVERLGIGCAPFLIEFAISGLGSAPSDVRGMALSALIRIGGLATPEFWRQQAAAADEQAASLAVLGLAIHGLHEAFAELPEYIASRRAAIHLMESMILFFERFGKSRTLAAISYYLPGYPEELRDLLLIYEPRLREVMSPELFDRGREHLSLAQKIKLAEFVISLEDYANQREEAKSVLELSAVLSNMFETTSARREREMFGPDAGDNNDAFAFRDLFG
jgi:hypothetical protein